MLSSIKLPKKLIDIKNTDKGFTEVWTQNRSKDIANFPHPSRVVLLGPPSMGKSFLMKHLLLRQRPMFKELYIIHGDGQCTTEFNDLEPTKIMDEIPPIEFFDSKVKTIVFIDEFSFEAMNKETTARCNKLFRYVSSHKNVSIYCSHQLCFELPSLIRKLANVWIIWKPRSMTETRLIANRICMSPDQLVYIFEHICNGYRDSLCVDFHKDTPAFLRKNLWEPRNLSDIKVQKSKKNNYKNADTDDENQII